MHLKLLRATRIAGLEHKAGAVVDLSPSDAAELVRSGKAEPVDGRGEGGEDAAGQKRRQYRKERKQERERGRAVGGGS